MKRILVIPDVKGWTYDFNFRELQKALKGSDTELEVSYNQHHPAKGYDGYIMSYWRQRAGTDGGKGLWGTGLSSWRWSNERGNTQPGQIPPTRDALHILGMFRAVYVTSMALYRHVQHMRNTFYCPFGVDPKVFRPDWDARPTGEMVIGWAGHPSPNKRLNVIKAAVEKVKGVRLETREYRTDSYTTDRHEMAKFYNSLDAYVICSETEGEPKTAKEAAACGVPLIATGVGCVPDLVTDDLSGYLFDGTVDGLVEKLEALKDNRDKLRSAGEAILVRGNEFLMPNVLPFWDQYFRAVIGGHW